MATGRQWFLSALLTGGVAATTWLVYIDSGPVQPPLEAGEKHLPSDIAEPVSQTIIPIPPLSDYSEVVARPLFSLTRKPPALESNETSAVVNTTTAGITKPIEKNQYKVMGIIITGEEKVALLQPANKKGGVLRAREGKRLIDSEWTVESITPEAVIIRQRTVTDTLKLSENKLSETEKRRLVQQAARARARLNQKNKAKPGNKVAGRKTRKTTTRNKTKKRTNKRRTIKKKPRKRTNTRTNRNSTVKKQDR
ncbi:MAG: hypothetical protein GY703_09280 [Gammaproteobacteria bacterium]|nr:hypothetical protein [Gammaproteobacteria bacterium]